MSETKFTPGPWTVHHRMRDCVTFEGKFGTENLFLENREGYYACQSEHDAHLIAAAPELYEALEVFGRLADQLDGDNEVQRTPDDEWAKFRLLASDYRKARAALAKARGES
ncbi:hypothetical protein C6W88_15745 [Halomonas litopenaei]|uniref:Uncharacterized protein n=1 Tax=Halomonas litopenaei TaxID=2109328 RepID=A0ABX5IUU1_9GAMM|nr:MULTISPECIES: hypothetical protein [Halomonas]PTL88833.1 hypothetical protein C6W89_19960 [Halomonas sp. SYSU XM8]PTL93464.1 hypothetical protein C6W88_15745 [Halomonas litopenaei]